jgi:hypothetical protein
MWWGRGFGYAAVDVDARQLMKRSIVWENKYNVLLITRHYQPNLDSILQFTAWPMMDLPTIPHVLLPVREGARNIAGRSNLISILSD